MKHDNLAAGGPAFPVADPFATHQPGHEDEARRLMSGMTLRDYFAAHEPIEPNESIGVILAEQLTGRAYPHPESFDTPGGHAIAAFRFWAEAEAIYRYLRADAMLRAREGVAS